MSAQDFEIPAGLGEYGRDAAKVIKDRIRRAVRRAPCGGGCRAFYTPEEWAARGERGQAGSVLIVVHDGGDAAPHFNLDYCDYTSVDRMDKALERIGLHAEPCTTWFTFIRKTGVYE